MGTEPTMFCRALPAMSLTELESIAGLLTRTDRKYVVPVGVVAALLEAPPGDWSALEIAGRREFRYDSTYFDTDDLVSYRGAAHRRRSRFKVRTRTYVDSGACLLEVKTKTQRGRTVKVRSPHDPARPQHLDPEDREFVEAQLGVRGVAVGLVPVLGTEYVRSTIVDRADRSRLTIDQRFVIRAPGSERREFSELVIVETKSIGPVTTADRWLWRHGHRPVRISKYCVGMALVHPELPANRWRRVIQRHFVADHGPPALARVA